MKHTRSLPKGCGCVGMIIQARMTSRRLPGKVLMPIMGRPMLSLQVERLRRCKLIDAMIVATSQDASDTPIADLCRDESIMFFRGDLHDVLDRYYSAAKRIGASHVVRVTADCPIIDPEIVDEVVSFYFEGDYDFVSNALVPTFPDGLDVSVFKFEMLEEAWNKATAPADREHVTPYMKNQIHACKIGNYTSGKDYSHLRWTVDEAVDMVFVRKIFEHLYPVKKNFSMKDVTRLLEVNPHLVTLNAGLRRNEGYK